MGMQMIHKPGSHPYITRFLGMTSNMNFGIDGKLFYDKSRVIRLHNDGKWCGLIKDAVIDHERNLQNLCFLANHNRDSEEILIGLHVESECQMQGIRFLDKNNQGFREIDL
jgi:hypothetical protein